MSSQQIRNFKKHLYIYVPTCLFLKNKQNKKKEKKIRKRKKKETEQLEKGKKITLMQWTEKISSERKVKVSFTEKKDNADYFCCQRPKKNKVVQHHTLHTHPPP